MECSGLSRRAEEGLIEENDQQQSEQHDSRVDWTRCETPTDVAANSRPGPIDLRILLFPSPMMVSVLVFPRFCFIHRSA
jgi:hypothetical protein